MLLRLCLVALVLSASAVAQPASSPLDAVALPPAAVVTRHSTRDVALEVVYSADGALLNWRCTVSPHPAFCAPTAAVAAWAGAPTSRRQGRPGVFRLPVAFWLPEGYDCDAPDASPLPSEPPRDVLSRWRAISTRSYDLICSMSSRFSLCCSAVSPVFKPECRCPTRLAPTARRVVRYSLPLTYCLADGGAPTPLGRRCE